VVLFGGAALAAAARMVLTVVAARPGRNALLVPLLPVFDDPTAGQLGQLFVTMLKIGSVLFGSGYVLLAFLEGDFVDRLGWVTQQQLVDAVSIGQVTPGPVFTTATFLGYLVAGLPGAFVATVGIFLPSFVLVGLLTRVVDLLRASPWTSVALDGLNAAALALMAGVTWQLGREAIVDGWTVAIAVVALVLLWRTRLNSAWYVAGGAAAGLLIGLL
jgi:chromate transporter